MDDEKTDLSETEINSFIEEQNSITKSFLKIKGVTKENLSHFLEIQRYFIKNLKPKGLINVEYNGAHDIDVTNSKEDQKSHKNEIEIEQNFSKMDSDDSVYSVCMLNSILKFHDYCKDNEGSDVENIKLMDNTPITEEAIVINKPYCIRCKIVLEDVVKYREHVHNSHVQSGQKDKQNHFQCELCGKIFQYKTTLKDHARTHSDQVACICEICGTGFKAFGTLRRHLKIHRNQRSYLCELCDKRFNTKELLRLHVYMVHSPDQWKYTCPVCSRKFSLKTNMNNHLNIHANKSFNCDYCNRKFRNVKPLIRHQKTCAQK